MRVRRTERKLTVHSCSNKSFVMMLIVPGRKEMLWWKQYEKNHRSCTAASLDCSDNIRQLNGIFWVKVSLGHWVPNTWMATNSLHDSSNLSSIMNSLVSACTNLLLMPLAIKLLCCPFFWYRQRRLFRNASNSFHIYNAKKKSKKQSESIKAEEEKFLSKNSFVE